MKVPFFALRYQRVELNQVAAVYRQFRARGIARLLGAEEICGVCHVLKFGNVLQGRVVGKGVPAVVIIVLEAKRKRQRGDAKRGLFGKSPL